LETQVEWLSLRRGEVLFHHGAEPDGVYLVVNGRLIAVVPDDTDGDRILGEIGAGEVLGEMGQLTKEPRSATVIAVRETDVVRCPPDVFESFVTRYPHALMRVTLDVVARLRRSAEATHRGQVRTLAVVPLAPDVPATELAEKLTQLLASEGTTVHLSSTLIEATTGRADHWSEAIHETQLRSWLDQQEAENRFTVFEADVAASGWTRHCLQRADKVLFVAWADGDRALGPSETLLEPRETRLAQAQGALVLLHRPGTKQPSHTADWLTRRPVGSHYHILWDRPEDIARLARRLSGKAVGVAFAGGGARGFGHIGVVRALEEAGIPIDMVGGTSMGAVIAAMVGMGLTPSEIVAANRTAWIDSKPMRDLTLPLFSLLGSTRLDAMSQGSFGDTQIEDLWLPMFCVSSNLSQGRMMIHRQGTLWQAVRASASMPGIALPVVMDGDLLVDGALLNNLPGDVMRHLYGGYVLAVEVNPEKDLLYSGERLPSPWATLGRRLRSPKIPLDVPTIIDVLFRTTVIASLQSAARVQREADLFMHLPVDEVGLTQFDALDAATAAGYDFAKRQIADWEAEGLIDAGRITFNPGERMSKSSAT
jgi:predicted acylesterase/phospholipase RssA